VKNFLVLFFASTFIATIAFQLAGALRRLMVDGLAWRNDPGFALDAVKPVLFIGFFVENLGVSFLPQLMQRSAKAAGFSPTVASLMFMTYFLCFAASLIPGGLLAARWGAKPLICVGATLAMAGLACLAWTDQALVIIVGRIAAGFGQGLLFIGAQSFILARADAAHRTRGAGLIVTAFNGGMICGMALGSLLVGYVGERGVFGIAVAVTLAGVLFAMAALPSLPGRPRKRGRGPLQMARALLSTDFVSAVLLVGVPAKAVLTGVVVFAMPLVLSTMRLPQEDIGQVMMVYALGVLLASGYATRLADRLGATHGILLWGTLSAGAGLIAVGLADWAPVVALGQVATVAVILAGIAVLGLAHGCINAPVVTYVATTRAAQINGEVEVSAFYRFIERIGHIGGPLVLGQLLALSGQRPVAIAWVGIATLGCWPRARRQPTPPGSRSPGRSRRAGRSSRSMPRPSA
jgi:MFS family permease